jgi:hypothetical protein
VRRDRLDRHLPTAAKETLMRSNRNIRRLCTIATATLLVVIAVSALGCGASARQKTLATTLVALDGASSTLVAYDQQHQAAIVAGATSLEDGKAKLAAWRADRTKIVDALAAAYRALALAATLNDDPKSLTNLAAAAAIVMAEVTALKGPKP